MPHSPAEKKRAITRLRRIRGQADALERAIEAGSDCGEVLQQLAAMRGAINGLMAEVLHGHLRESFGHTECTAEAAAQDPAHARQHEAIDQVVALVRSYLR